MISEDDKELLRRLMEARQDYDEAAALEKRLKSVRDEVELDVFDHFENAGVMGSIKADLGEPWGVVSFRTRETHYAQIIDSDEVEEHYAQRAMLDEVSAPKFVKARLNEEVRECLDQGRDLPPGLSYYTNRGMTVTRQKS